MNEKKQTNQYLLIVGVLSLFLYGSLGLFFAYTTDLVYHPKYICDIYFGFDNAFHDTSAVRHPLLKMFSEILKFAFKSVSSFRISFVLVVICSVLLSIQNIFVFKILFQIFNLSKAAAFFFTGGFAISGSNLLLSFTFDSYVFSSSFLSVFFFYFLKAEKEQKRLKIYLLVLMSFIIGGITITNFFKIALVSLYSSFRKLYFKSIFAIFCIFGVTYLINYKKVEKSLFFIFRHFDVETDYFRNITDYFLGSIFLIPKPMLFEIRYIDGTLFNTIIGQYFFTTEFILLIVLLSSLLLIIIKTIKYKIIQFLVLSFSIDVIIHAVLGLGLKEAYIFAGNYSFIWILILGFSYSVTKTQKWKTIFKYWFLLFFVIFFFINVNNLIDFWLLSNTLKL